MTTLNIPVYNGLDIETYLNNKIKTNGGNFNKIRFVLVEDEDLTSYHLENYMSSLTDLEVIRLWNQKQFNYQIEYYALPFIISSNDIISSSNFSIFENQASQIQELISSSMNLNQEQIFIFPQLLHIDYYNSFFFDFFKDVSERKFFKKNVALSQKPFFNEQKQEKISIRFLPISILRETPCIYYPKQQRTDLSDFLILPRIYFIANSISNIIKYKTVPYPYLVKSCNLDEFCESFQISIQLGK